MQWNELDQTMMKNTSVIIFFSSLNILSNINQNPVHVMWQIKCFGIGEMHQRPDMVPIEP